MRCAYAWVLLLGGVAGAGAASHETRVTYHTASTLYLDAGAAEGLGPGTELTVTRGSERVATCVVGEVSTHKATCRITDRLLEPRVGDVARFVPAPAAAEVGREAVRQPARRPTRGAGIHGRVGLRYFVVRDGAAGGETTLSQPALDLRVDGSGLAGGAWGFDLDTRARRTTRTRAGESERESRTRVYRAALSRSAGADPWSLVVGRQFSPAVAAVSVFDGVAAEYRRARWAAGLISGSQPDPVDYGYSTRVREHGVYFRYGSGPAATRRVDVTTGLIGSYQDSEVNREFVYVQTRFAGPRLSLYAAEEIDYNRGWKADAEGRTVSMTSSYVNLSLRATSRLDLRAGYDSRRNVRLYRDFVNPEIEFDDSIRRGLWAGASVRVGERLTLGLDARTNGGGGAGDSAAYTANVGATRLAGRFDLRFRTTRYENDVEQGWLHALTVGARLGQRLHLRVGGGSRDAERSLGPRLSEDLRWLNADLELTLGRRWYGVLSVDRTTADDGNATEIHSGLTYRF